MSSVKIMFAYYDCVRQHAHAQFPSRREPVQTWNEVRFGEVALTDELLGLKSEHVFEGDDGDGDARYDPSPEHVIGSRAYGLRGVRDLPDGNWPAHKTFGIVNVGDSTPWMGATAPSQGVLSYRIFSVVVPAPFGIVSSLVLTDSLWSLGGVDDSSELVFLAAQAAASL